MVGAVSRARSSEASDVESAAYTFGLAEPPTGYEMHYIIALRNVWLGLLAIAFVLFRQWYALTLWFGLGVFVCFADAAIAASSSGGTAQVAFHMSSGVLCAGLAVLLGRIAGLATYSARSAQEPVEITRRKRAG